MAAPQISSMSTIRLLRAVAGLSQRELAQAAGVSPSRYWRLERGVSEPQREELARLWNALSTE
jgi:transcriptional regulator with XRE-family HTH domain